MPRTVISLLAAALLFTGTPARARSLDDIRHVVVIYLENHSFDNLYALFPGADGAAAPTARWAPQVDRAGKPYEILPPVMATTRKPMRPDPRFPANLANAPFLIDQYVPENALIPDLVHRFYQNQEQIDGGRNDRFAAISDAGGLTMGFYDARATRLWDYARRYTLLDRYFQGAFGGSFLNHFWLICACTPRFPYAPAALVAALDAAGRLKKDGAVTPDGYAVNTLFSSFQPHPARVPAAFLLPPQTMATIGDRLEEKGVSWAWYSGGWNDALAGRPAESFQYHHHPFAYFARYGDGTAGRRRHLKDESDLLAAIDAGALPAVAFYKPLGVENQHPGYANITNADVKAADVIERIRRGPQWRSTVIVVTYDENGGFWDHVAPPGRGKGGDRWGPGTRVPTLIVSPLARRRHVDHSRYDTTSILRLIELRWRLRPLGTRDAAADPFRGAFPFPISRN